jgi:hypothetical protein
MYDTILYINPPEANEKILESLGRREGGAPYCEIPFPYNMTTPP